MEYVKLFGADIKASRIGLGTHVTVKAINNRIDERDAIQTVISALDKGINVIETAPIYGFGYGETLVGKAVKEYAERRNVLVATEAGLEWINGKVRINASKERIMQEIDNSLTRLGMSYVDIYRIHGPDPNVPLEEIAIAMRHLLEQGKIRSVGVFNFTSTQMAELRKIVTLHTAQFPYNIFERSGEKDVFQYCHKHKITLFTCRPLCQGILTGKMTETTTFKVDDMRMSDPMFQPALLTQHLAVVKQLDEFARKTYQRQAIHLAVRWVLERIGAGVTLWGAHTPDQLAPVDEVMHWKLNADDYRVIDAILRKTITKPLAGETVPPSEYFDPGRYEVITRIDQQSVC